MRETQCKCCQSVLTAAIVYSSHYTLTFSESKTARITLRLRGAQFFPHSIIKIEKFPNRKHNV